jgi:hypothetical protein
MAALLKLRNFQFRFIDFLACAAPKSSRDASRLGIQISLRRCGINARQSLIHLVTLLSWRQRFVVAQQPVRPAESPRFGRKIDNRINIQNQFTPIDRDEYSRLNLKRLGSSSRHDRRQIVRKLEREIRKISHVGRLTRRQKVRQIDPNGFSRVRVRHIKIRKQMTEW